MTYNIWFSEYYREERTNKLLSLIKEVNPHVVCLQEMIPAVLLMFLSDENIRQHYVISDATGDFIYPYGVVILTKLMPCRLIVNLLPTRMGRMFLYCDISVGQEIIRIGTVHLESLDSSTIRKDQLRLISNVLKERKLSLLTGDFNFGEQNYEGNEDKPVENDVIKEYFPTHDDIWAKLHPGEAGVTVDCMYNISWTDEKKEKGSRYDRMLVSNEPEWEPLDITILGHESIANDDHNPNFKVFISDHLGLLSNILFK